MWSKMMSEEEEQEQEQEEMEKEVYDQGDLMDILRAACNSDWQFPDDLLLDHSIPNIQTISCSSSSSLPLGFGNPFCNTRDPLLNELSTGLVVGGASSSSLSVNCSADKAMNVNSSSKSSAGQISSPSSSSPRNPGVKRRKRQASKVVCIPAPATLNSRPTGEVVPSDLWAWRKYGQKPIKGSPHPRGYYRCSSSKGCSARKQVERSRTDPNMLVITYTSDHNHPWPTQRNALAGSTRKTPSTSKEEENKQTAITNNNANNNNDSTVKKEADHDHQDNTTHDHDHLNPHEFDDHYDHSEVGVLPISSQLICEDSFFAELGEIEADMLFTKAFTSSDEHHLLKDQKTKGSADHHDHSTLFDWPEENKGL